MNNTKKLKNKSRMFEKNISHNENTSESKNDEEKVDEIGSTCNIKDKLGNLPEDGERNRNENIKKMEKNKIIDTILFDFDGTLMDTNDVILKSWQFTFEQIRGERADDAVLLATFGEPLELTMHNFFGGTPEDVERNIEIYRSYQREHYLDLIDLFPGVYEMLEKVKAAGFRTALVTSRMKLTAYEGLKKYGIEKFFDYILTADDVTKHKPDPQPALTALKKLGSSPERAVMLGDTKQDILCAKNAGIVSVLVDWSMAIPKGTASGDYIPDYCLDEPGHLLKLISSINEIFPSH